jgi:hypothetical protein
MPADDLVLNVRQIAGYPPTSNAPTNASLLMQLGIGGPYQSISPQDLVATALSSGGDMTIGGQVSALSFQGGAAQFSNLATDLFSTTNGSVFNLSITGAGTLGGQPLATVADLAANRASSVTSFEGRVGAVCLWIQDILRAGGAPNFSPVFGGEPRAPTPGPQSNSSRLATTAFVTSALGALTLDFAPIDSPAFTGVPTAPTPPLGSSDATLATTAFVQTAVADSTAGVASFNTRTGIVTLTGADITNAGGAVLNSPAFTGTPTAPTAAPGTSTTQLATTAFVLTESGFAPLASPAFTGIPTAPTPTPGTNTTQLATSAFVVSALAGINIGVATFNGRQGAVSLIANDITAAGGAILASPAFTGTPTAPTPPPGDSSTRLATTAYVQTSSGFAPIASPAFTGVPTAPTAALGTNTLQLATTAFVLNEIASSTAGVASFNGRTGAVTLQANDLTAAGGALLNSPALTGSPSAPTAALGTSTTQLATTAFVAAATAAATAGGPFLPLAGGVLTGPLTPSVAGIVGSTLGNNAASGAVGEYLTAGWGPIGMTSGTPTQIGALGLTAGDWDVWGGLYIEGGTSTSITVINGWLNNSAANPGPGPGFGYLQISGGGGLAVNSGVALQPVRMVNAAAFTVFLTGVLGFSGGTANTGGWLAARRRR